MIADMMDFDITKLKEKIESFEEACFSVTDSQRKNITATRLHIKAFYSDYEKFTESKRFKRFVSYVNDAINNYFDSFFMFKGNIPEQASVRIPFIELVKDAVDFYTTIYCKEDEDCIGPLESVSTLSIIGKIPKRMYSNLWSINAMINDTGKDEFLMNEDGVPIVLQEVQLVLEGRDANDNDVFEMLYNDAFKRACYDYIVSQTLINHLEENNWLSRLKIISIEQLLIIMTRIFEYTLHGVEDYAACGLIYSKEDVKENAVLKNVYDFLSKKNEFDKTSSEKEATIQKLEKSVEAKEQEIQILTDHCKKIEKELFSIEKGKQDNAELQRELKKLRSKYEDLNKKYDSLLYFTEQLETAEDDTDEEEEILSAADDVFKTKRIVFVRDKKYDGCVIIRKLAEYYPNAKFTNVIASEINAKTTDLIVAITPYICHGTYWGAKNISDKKDIPMINVKKTNLGAIVAQIDKAFEKEQ